MERIKTAISAAIKAGEVILKVYARDFKVEFKTDESPLTEADQAAHKIIIQELAETPYPVLSEESETITYEERKDWETYWLVDPLDGTKEFIKKNGEFTVNIALIESGVPILGVVYVPVLDVMYCGMSNGRCWKWDVGSEMLDVKGGMSAWKATDCVGKSISEIMQSAKPLSTSNISLPTSHCSPPTNHHRPLRIVASKSHCNDETRDFIAELEKDFGSAALLSRGSSLKLCMVAEGSADIYPRIAPTMEWDTAAAHAVVKAAGGEVFEYDPTVPAIVYLCEKSDVESKENVGSEMLDVECGKLDDMSSHLPPPTSHLSPPTKRNFHLLRYNKENLLNPHFVVVGY
jgi:3'(2'), 5'-bisphosphate nucleotidase